MNDRTKTCLSILFFASMFILPLVGVGIGWIGWDLQTGAIIGLITFAALFLLAGILLTTVQELSWLTVSLPMAVGFIYSLLPDFFPGPIDDTVAFTAGALLTFALWLKKQPDAPKWVIFPLIISSLYTLVGGFIPGPIDELLVTGISAGTAAYGNFSRQLGSGQEIPSQEYGETVEGQFEVEE
jgi:hypothetical protein